MYNDNMDYARQQEIGLSAYISKVFGWMFIGLLFTAGAAMYVASSPAIMLSIVGNRILFFGLMIGELLLVSYLARGIYRMSYSRAVSVFVFYSLLNGVTLSVILWAYTFSSVSYTFAITAVTFGAMSLYGYVTRTDLTRFGNLLFMGLIGIIILSLVNFFLRSSQMEWLISIVGLFVFLGLTAYDTQKIKEYYYATEANPELRNKVAITGALSLYLDFINLFLILLRLFGVGNRRD